MSQPDPTPSPDPKRSERPKKAVVLVCDASVAQQLADLIAAMLSLNGYAHNGASVIDWPIS